MGGGGRVWWGWCLVVGECGDCEERVAVETGGWRVGIMHTIMLLKW